MDNDPNKNSLNKNDSKGKRLFKKAIRRISKSSNNSQSSSLGGISRSRSVENKIQSSEINDSTPLPKPDGTEETALVAGYSKVDDRKIDKKHETHANGGTMRIKNVDIQENRNVVFRSPSTSKKTSRLSATPELVVKEENACEVEGVKRNLKRRLEEESGAATSGPSTGTSDGEIDDKDPTKVKRKKNRCAVCGKKVGLTGFLCRCGGLFCAVHRYSDKHDCSFDYKELGAQEIRRNNPVVTSQKIDKI